MITKAALVNAKIELNSLARKYKVKRLRIVRSRKPQRQRSSSKSKR